VRALRSSRFAPHRVEPERLLSLFVGRHELLARLVSDVRATAAGGGARFELVGPLPPEPS
jgi:hypothetical protein